VQPDQATEWVTEARFAPYLAEAHGDHELAVRLYVWNARVSAACFETLHHVEVLVRNAVDAQFVPFDVTASPRNTWLEDASILNDAARHRVAETIARISRDGKTDARSGRRGVVVRLLARAVRQEVRRAVGCAAAPRVSRGVGQPL